MTPFYFDSLTAFVHKYQLLSASYIGRNIHPSVCKRHQILLKVICCCCLKWSYSNSAAVQFNIKVSNILEEDGF